MDARRISEEELLVHAIGLRRLAARLVGDGAAADDLVQDTLLAGLEHPPFRAHPNALRSWLARVMRNLAGLRWRGEQSRERRELRAAPAEALPSSAELVERMELNRVVAGEVLNLPEPYRTALLSFYFDGVPAAEHARAIGVPAATVRSHLKRGIELLRQRLQSRTGADFAALEGGLILLAHTTPAPAAASGPTSIAMGGLLVTKSIVGIAALAAAITLAVLWRANLRPEVPVGPHSPTSHATPPAAVGRSGDSAPAAAAAIDEAAADPGRSLAAPPASELVVEGRVTDESGAPVAGARVQIGGERDPFPPESPAPAVAWNDRVGRAFPTDSEGRYAALLPRAGEVQVVLVSSEQFAVPAGAAHRTVSVPARGVDFVVQRLRTARLDVHLIDAASRRPIETLGVVATGERIGLSQKRTRAGVITYAVPLDGPGDGAIRVQLFDPEPTHPVEQWLTPVADGELVLVLKQADHANGFVVDPDGAPIEGALVFFGAVTLGRGDEPFKDFDPARISGGVKSASDGWFDLVGNGQLVTAWHPSYTYATVDASRSARIALRPLAGLRVRLVDHGRAPVPGKELRLDDKRKGRTATTDAQGAASFEAVGLEAHALWLEGRLLTCVRVQGDTEVTVEVADPDSGRFELELRGAALADVGEQIEGLLVGRDQLFGIHEVEQSSSDDARTILEARGRIVPGEYLLVTRQGIAALLAVEGERAAVEVGTAVLEVRGRGAVRAQIVPHDSDDFARLLAARLPCAAAAGGTIRFRVAPGRYDLVGEAGRVLRTLDVPPEGLAVELD